LRVRNRWFAPAVRWPRLIVRQAAAGRFRSGIGRCQVALNPARSHSRERFDKIIAGKVPAAGAGSRAVLIGSRGGEPGATTGAGPAESPPTVPKLAASPR
jgi:hypothetical protein